MKIIIAKRSLDRALITLSGQAMLLEVKMVRKNSVLWVVYCLDNFDFFLPYSQGDEGIWCTSITKKPNMLI